MTIKEGWEWFKYAISRISDYRGRAGRAEYSCFLVFQVVIFFLCYRLDLIFHSFPAFVGVYAAFTLVPSYLLVVRRLHDCGYEGKWALLCFILFPALLILAFLPSDKAEPNAYGFTERLIYLERKPHKFTGPDDAMVDYVPVEHAIEQREEEEQKVEKEIKEITKEEEKEPPTQSSASSL